MRPVAITALYLIAAPLIAPLAFAAGDAPEGRSEKEHDFAGKAIYVVSKPTDAKSDCCYALLENVKVISLAGRGFLAGEVAPFGEGEAYKAAAGKKFWIPISDILQLTEFSTADEARQYFAKARGKADNPDR